MANCKAHPSRAWEGLKVNQPITILIKRYWFVFCLYFSSGNQTQGFVYKPICMVFITPGLGRPSSKDSGFGVSMDYKMRLYLNNNNKQTSKQNTQAKSNKRNNVLMNKEPRGIFTI